MAKFKDLTGQRFGRWTVLYRTTDHIEKDGRHRVVYHCRCDCGNEADVISGSLGKGQSKSCGCLQREWAKSGVSKRKHGLTGTRIYRIWKNMNTRCNNPNNKKWDRYGGRGIKICDEWQGENGFENFYEWSMSNGYADNLTIDRQDNDKGYSPNNCRWVPFSVQSNNTSQNRNITVNGETKTIAEWSDLYGLNRPALYAHSDEEVYEILKEIIK